MYQEFPKWVYPDGSAVGVLVQDAEQELQALADFSVTSPDAADAPKRRSRPPKAE